jgi:hypothetical protein
MQNLIELLLGVIALELRRAGQQNSRAAHVEINPGRRIIFAGTKSAAWKKNAILLRELAVINRILKSQIVESGRG